MTGICKMVYVKWKLWQKHVFFLSVCDFHKEYLKVLLRWREDVKIACGLTADNVILLSRLDHAAGTEAFCIQVWSEGLGVSCVGVWVSGSSSLQGIMSEIDRQIGSVSAITSAFYPAVVVKIKQSWKVKLSIYHSHPHSNLQLWSWALGSDWRKWIVNNLKWVSSIGSLGALLQRRLQTSGGELGKNPGYLIRLPSVSVPLGFSINIPSGTRRPRRDFISRLGRECIKSNSENYTIWMCTNMSNY